MMFMTSDGWLDESSEGPYTLALLSQGPWEILRLTHWEYYKLSKGKREVGRYGSIKEAKDAVRVLGLESGKTLQEG